MPHRRPSAPITPLLAILVALVPAARLVAANKPEEAPPEVRYRTAIEEAVAQAGRLRDAPGSIEGDYARAANFMRADLAVYRKLCESLAVLHEKIAAAYKLGDVEAVRTLRVEIDKADKDLTVWRYRLIELRVRQATAAPSESNYVEESRWYPPGAFQYLDALVEAKRASADAWGRAAEATVPGADYATVTAAREEAYALEAEREIAQWRFDAALNRERTVTEKGLSSPEMTRAAERLAAVQAQREQLRREEVQRDRRQREIEREMTAAQKAFNDAYNAAVTERNRQKAAQR